VKTLLLGANGQVGWELQRSLLPVSELIVIDRQKLNLKQTDLLRKVVKENKPDFIVNAAAYTSVDGAELDHDEAHSVNARAVAILAEEAKLHQSLLVHYSTDYVFDGRKQGRYVESDITNPLSVYGKTKLDGEKSIREIDCNHLILRTSWVYSSRSNNFVKTILKIASEKDEINVVNDQVGAPTHAELIADVTSHILHLYMSKFSGDVSSLKGTYHLSAEGETNWYEFAIRILNIANDCGFESRLKRDDINAVSSEEYITEAERPKNSRLNCDKLKSVFNLRLPEWECQLKRCIETMVGPVLSQ
jgi:dTDP-4-dehydrorhamnose reductase